MMSQSSALILFCPAGQASCPDDCNSMWQGLYQPVESCWMLWANLCAVLWQPGDCIILNGANSTVGQILVQLCFLLKLRCIALVRAREDFSRIQQWLQACGASQVLPDAGSIEAQLQKFQARPKLGLDCIGGSSTTRISNSLHEVGRTWTLLSCWPHRDMDIGEAVVRTVKDMLAGIIIIILVDGTVR